MSDHFAGDPRTNRERMLAGELYIADDPDSQRQMFRAVQLQNQIHQRFGTDPDGAMDLVRELFGHFGQGAFIRPPLFVDYGTYVHVGARTMINYNLTALDVAPIVIGDDCQIGPNVQLLTPTHPVEPKPRRDKLEAALPITIGDNVWLGGGVIVLPGVTIGDNSVVGAGAVVTKSIPADVVAVGNPARLIRPL